MTSYSEPTPWDEFEENDEAEESNHVIAVPYFTLTRSDNDKEIVIAADFIGAYFQSPIEKTFTLIHCFGGIVFSVKESVDDISRLLGFKNG